MVLTTINSEGHFRSAFSYDINEQWRLIEHIDVIVGTDDSKKTCQIQRSWSACKMLMASFMTLWNIMVSWSSILFELDEDIVCVWRREWKCDRRCVKWAQIMGVKFEIFRIFLDFLEF
jgi:hypothetical protein